MEKPKLKIKAVLLDLDGTILDSKAAYLEAVKTAFKTLGRNTFDVVAIFEIPKRLEQGLPIDEFLQGLDVREFLDVYLKAFYRVTTVKSKPLVGVRDALERLSKKAKLALITMRYVPKSQVLAELEGFGLAKYFSHVVTALDTRQPKPCPEALIRCVMELNTHVRDCVVVGDSVVDVQAGRNAGVGTVAVLSGIYSREELERECPDLILESVCFLPDFLE